MSEQLLDRVRRAAANGEISCAAAHRLAQEAGAEPIEIGRLVNRDTDLRFYRCQLGFFGYGPKAEGKHRIVLEARDVPEEIAAALRARTRDGRISCLDAWRVADEFEYPRLAIANIIERMGLRVKPCQLGCF